MYRYLVDLKLTAPNGSQRTITVVQKAKSEFNARINAEIKAAAIEGVAFIRATNAFYMGKA